MVTGLTASRLLHPGLDAHLKAITALVSIATAVLLRRSSERILSQMQLGDLVRRADDFVREEISTST